MQRLRKAIATVRVSEAQALEADSGPFHLYIALLAKFSQTDPQSSRQACCDQLLHGWNMDGWVQAFSNFSKNPVVAAGAGGRSKGRTSIIDEVMEKRGIEIFLLQVEGARKDQVSQLGRVGHEGVNHHLEGDRPERPTHPVGIRRLVDGVGSVGPDHFHRWLGSQDIPSDGGLEEATDLVTCGFSQPAQIQMPGGRSNIVGPTPGAADLTGNQGQGVNETHILGPVNVALQPFSGGERKRVFIAKALAQEPEVILLDEPTANLDIHHQIEFLDLILGLNREKGLTILMATHDINLASEFCDRLILLRQGEIFKTGRPAEVITEENMGQVYGCEVWVGKHPVSGMPRVSLLKKGIQEDGTLERDRKSKD